MDSIAFAMHIAANGIFEYSDYVGIYVSLNGGKDYYPQLKLRGSKSGTKMKGWRHGEGIHYMKDFRCLRKPTVDDTHLHTCGSLPLFSNPIFNVKIHLV